MGEGKEKETGKEKYSVSVFDIEISDRPLSEYSKEMNEKIKAVRKAGGRVIGFRTDPKANKGYIVYASKKEEVPEDYEIRSWDRRKGIESSVPVQRLAIRADDTKVEPQKLIVVLRKELEKKKED